MMKQVIVLTALIHCAIAVMPLNKKLIARNNKVEEFQDESEAYEESNFQLPHNTAPRVYKIEFDPDFEGESFTFKGNSTIIFEVLEPTSTVILHGSNRITIDKDLTELIDKNGVSMIPKKQKWNSLNEFYSIEFEEELEPENYTLKLKWDGVDSAEDWFSTRMGFFRVYDKLEDDTLQYLVTTHFQPSGARSAFPCWDEPGFKAEFEISLKHFPNYTALSNMPEKYHRWLPGGKIITYFKRSVKMSPYLPCVAIAHYKAIKNIYGNITFYALESKLESLRFALEVSEKVIPAMEAYTDVSYALPKLDQIAIPQYTEAMEHWGLVTYHIDAVELEKSSLAPNIEQRDNIAFLVAHELAHQWFGNLVSPIWWDDTWLNEAFADYFQIKILDQIYPSWHIMDFYIVQNINRDSHDAETRAPEPKPIKWNPRNKISTEFMFSDVTYYKGDGFVHMLEHVLTKDVFREGIQRHLKAHKFSTAVPDDLWNAFQEVYDERYKYKVLDIKETMDPWIEQTGTPIVTVTRDYETGETSLTQKNYQNLNSDNKWRIPINYATKSNPDFSSSAPTMWMEKDSDITTIRNINADDWIILNIQQGGFYRVNYDKENWWKIAEYLRSNDYSKIHPINRAQILYDVSRIYQDDQSYLEILVSITSYLHQETDYLPWIPASNIIMEMLENMRNTPEEDLFKTYILFLTSEITNKLGFENEGAINPPAVRIRSKLAPLLCEFGHADCRSFSQQLFLKFLQDPSKNTLPSSDWEWIVCSGLRESNYTTRKRFLATKFEENPKIVSPTNLFIRCTDDLKLRHNQISLLIAKDATDSEQVNAVFKSLLESNRDDVNWVLNYFTDHFYRIKLFYDQFQDDEYLIPILRMSLAIKSVDQYNKFKTFIEDIVLNVENLPKSHLRLLRSALKDSSNQVNLAKNISRKFNELVDNKLLRPHTIDIDKR